MFAWSNDYSVGIPGIDAQHQNLFRIGGELYTAMTTGQSKAVLGKILDRLVQYTSAHFAHEERLMRLNNYRDFPAHLAEHQALKAQVVQFQSDFHAGHGAISIQLLQFLKDWLEKHIKGSDRKYAPYMKNSAA